MGIERFTLKTGPGQLIGSLELDFDNKIAYLNQTSLVLGGEPVSVGEQRVRLLGPFHVAHDTEGIGSTGTLLTPLPAGTWLLAVAVIATEQWQNITEGFVMTVGLGTAANGFDMGYETEDGDALNMNLTNPDILLGYGDARNADVRFASIGLVNDGGLYAGFFPNNEEALIGGEADIYALIAEPM